MTDKLGKNRTALLKDIKVDNLDLSNVDLDEFKNESNDPYVRESEVPKDVSDLTDNQDKLGDKNVKSDWDASSGDAEILNKPDIPTDIDDLTDATGILSGKEDKSNKVTNLNNPNNEEYPTTKAVADALSEIDTEVETTNSDTIILSGNGTQSDPLKAELDGNIDLDDFKNESADPYARLSEVVNPEIGEIGTRNYFDNSDFSLPNPLSGWRQLRSNNQIINGNYRKTFTDTVTTSSRFEKSFELDEVGTYVFSFRVRASKEGELYMQSSENFNVISGLNNIIDTEWKIINWVISVDTPNLERIFRLYVNYSDFQVGDWVEIDWIKLEKGSIPSDWTPSLNDVKQRNDLTYVKFNEPQSLSPEEQQQARENIGVKPQTILKTSNFLIDNDLNGSLVIHEDVTITINKTGLDSMGDGFQVWLRNDSNNDATLSIVNSGNYSYRINGDANGSSNQSVPIKSGGIVRIDKKDNNKIIIYTFPEGGGGGGDLELGWSAGQAAEGNQVVRTTTNQTVGGTKTFSEIPLLPNSNPTTDNQAVRKKYVDDKVDSKEDAFSKNTAFNKDFGWNSGQVAEGNGVVRTSTNQTISGVKTFESIPVLPNSNPTTNNQATRKKYVDDQVGSRELLSNKVQDIMSNISPDLYPSTQAVALFAQYILNEFDTEISNYFSTKYRTSDFTLTEDYRLNTIIAGNIEIEIDPNEEVHTSFKCDIVSDHSSGTGISLKSKSGWTYRVNDVDDISSTTFRIPAGGKISIYKKTDNQKFIIVGNADMQS